jgi:hypothetical protein
MNAATIPDTITITEYHFLDIKSNGADVECSTTAHTGRESTPPLVKAVAKELSAIGVKESALSVTNLSRSNDIIGCAGGLLVFAAVISAIALESRGIKIETAAPYMLAAAIVIMGLAWHFGRQTTCSFKITCADNETVDRLQQLLSEKFQKVTLLSTAWRYDVPSKTLAEWADQCIERANARAARVATALGVQIIGVHSYEEKHELPQRHYSSDHGAPAMARSRAAAPYEMKGGGSARVGSYVAEGQERSGAHVRIEYRVTNYRAVEGPAG